MKPHWAIRGILAITTAAVMIFTSYFLGCVFAWRSNGDSRWFYGLLLAGTLIGVGAVVFICKWPFRRS